MKDASVGDGFLTYFSTRKNKWDAVHLELALWWLGKNGSLAAHHEIANYLYHANTSIRFLAIGFTSGMKHEVDAKIMISVIEALQRNPDRADKKVLNSILSKPASKDAQALAQLYFNKTDSNQ